MAAKEAKIFFNGKKIFSDTEHVMAIQPYSMPFKGKIDLKELLKHIVYSKKKPHAYAYNCKLAYRYPFEKDWLISIPYERVKKLKKGSGNEYQLTDAMSLANKTKKRWCYNFRGKRYDCGSKLGYLNAQIAARLIDKDIKKEVKNIIKNWEKSL